METLTLIAEKGMSLSLAVEMARTIAARKGCGVYVMRQSDGYRACLFCDHNPAAVVAIVGVTGLLWVNG